MPDITMCKSILKDGKTKYPLREKCVRYISKPDEYRQSYFIEVPGMYVFSKEFLCVYFVKV